MAPEDRPRSPDSTQQRSKWKHRLYLQAGSAVRPLIPQTVILYRLEPPGKPGGIFGLPLKKTQTDLRKRREKERKGKEKKGWRKLGRKKRECYWLTYL